MSVEGEKEKSGMATVYDPAPAPAVALVVAAELVTGAIALVLAFAVAACVAFAVAACVLTFDVAVLGLGLGPDGAAHPAINNGATTTASVMSKRYFFTLDLLRSVSVRKQEVLS